MNLFTIQNYIINEFTSQNSKLAKKRYLFLVPFFLMSVFEYIILSNVQSNPNNPMYGQDNLGMNLFMTFGTGSMTGVICLCSVRILKNIIVNIYINFSLLVLLLTVFSLSQSKTYNLLDAFMGLISFLLPVLIVAKLILFLSTRK
jgi:hypothetical protein